ncbi:MAG TPA: hypothetical protein VJR50_14515 [Mycobacterium sp.]|nr:hypothetical protein [Mycobacterium sp.]
MLAFGLMLGGSAAGPASAAPGDSGHDRPDTASSKSINKDRPSLGRVIQRILSEHRRHVGKNPGTAPRTKIGSEPERGTTASEPKVTTFSEPDGPAGAAAGPPDADHVDNTVVRVADTQKKPSKPIDFPFWIVSSLGGVIDPYLATTRTTPDPEPMPAPAFRGPAPQAPAPEPVLDASGGVAGGGGSDFEATGFGSAPVLSAPVVAIPLPPPAAVRFPAPPSAPTPGTGAGAVRGAGAEPAVTASAIRRAGGPRQEPSSTSAPTGGQLSRRGYTDYLRSPNLSQLAGAALPGVAGILAMTVAGGVVGFRQAKAGRMIRSSVAARYLP